MKYKLTEETKTECGVILHRIECVEAFGCVKSGEKGGWIEDEKNLSQKGNAWVSGNAEVSGDAKVSGDAEVSGDAWVFGNAKVSSNADYIVFKNNFSSGRYFTWTRSNDMWKVGCFYGTGEELIKKAYADSEKKGRCYEAYVRLVETLKEVGK